MTLNTVRNDSGSIVSVLAISIVALVSLFIIVFYIVGQIVYPDEIGIRQNYFNIPGVLKEGFQDQGLLPGLHWKIPGLSTIHLIERDFQFVNLNAKDQIAGDLSQDQLEIPTTDGSKVKTDITLVLRFFENAEGTPKLSEDSAPAKQEITESDLNDKTVPYSKAIRQYPHGGPRELVNKYRTKKIEQLKIFSITAEESIKKALGTLSTTDYYNPVLREKAAILATEKINSEVNPDGISLWATLIRRYVYSEKNIDDQIFAKNLQEATEQVNKAERALEKARAETEMTQADLEATTKDLKVAGEQDTEVIMSEGDRIEMEKISEGDRLVQEARAGVDKAKNEVLTQINGADVYIAREMTPLLETLQGGIVTDIDPFNVDSWMEKLITTGK